MRTSPGNNRHYARGQSRALINNSRPALYRTRMRAQRTHSMLCSHVNLRANKIPREIDGENAPLENTRGKYFANAFRYLRFAVLLCDNKVFGCNEILISAL